MLQSNRQLTSCDADSKSDFLPITDEPIRFASDKAGLTWLVANDGGVAAFGPLSLSRANAFSASALARDWATLEAQTQSGLPYTWQDSRPVIPDDSSVRASMFGVKRALDVTLACLLLLFFMPILVAVALSIKLTSKGPVFFMQDRVGFGNETFRVYKFRTMYTDRQDASGVRQTVAGDARITPVGKFLRRVSLDEIPQIINILKGEMSFVGPRPHVPGMLAAGLLYEDLVPYYDLRHAIKPGLTGWAQANGFRGPTSDPIAARQRVDHDIAYIQNISVWLDVVIIARTAWREFVTGTGV